MKLTQGDRTIIIDTLLPKNPEERAIVNLPPGHTLGGANVINVLRGGKILGTASQVVQISLPQKKSAAIRVSSCARISRGDILQLVGWQYYFVSLIYFEDFGWVGRETSPNATNVLNQHVKVIEGSQLGVCGPEFYLYDQLCLSVIHEGETHEKPTSNTTPTPSRDTATPSGRTPLARGDSGSPPRTDPTEGSCENSPRKPTLIDVSDGSSE